MITPRRTIAPATTPVSLAEAKAHLRYDDADQDALILSLVEAATARLDGWSGILGRCLVTQTWALDLCGWPADRTLRLPFPSCGKPVVTYHDTAHAEQTLDAAGVSGPVEFSAGTAALIYGDVALPALSDRPAPVTLTFTAGYGAAASVPAPIKAAILLMVGDMFRHRETAGPGVMNAIPVTATVDALVAPYRRVTL